MEISDRLTEMLFLCVFVSFVFWLVTRTGFIQWLAAQFATEQQKSSRRATKRCVLRFLNQCQKQPKLAMKETIAFQSQWDLTPDLDTAIKHLSWWKKWCGGLRAGFVLYSDPIGHMNRITIEYHPVAAETIDTHCLADSSYTVI